MGESIRGVDGVNGLYVGGRQMALEILEIVNLFLPLAFLSNC